MAGVSAVPLPTQYKLIPSQRVGTDFLKSSHFHIAQDNSVSQAGFKSVFKKDYIPWEISSKPHGSTPPRPSEVLHRDDRFFSEKSSETFQVIISLFDASLSHLILYKLYIYQ